MSDTPIMTALDSRLYDEVESMLKKRTPISAVVKHASTAIFNKGCDLERENTRLRAALRAIADYAEQPDWMDSYVGMLDEIFGLAREALEQPAKS